MRYAFVLPVLVQGWHGICCFFVKRYEIVRFFLFCGIIKHGYIFALRSIETSGMLLSNMFQRRIVCFEFVNYYYSM